MTTILVANDMMMADRQMTFAEGHIFNLAPYAKMRRLKDGSIVGSAGNATHCNAVIEWLDGGTAPESDIDDFQILRLTKDGAFIYLGGLCPSRIMLPAAIGTGSGFALGALYAGATMDEAMVIAAKQDAFTGMDYDTLRLGDDHE